MGPRLPLRSARTPHAWMLMKMEVDGQAAAAGGTQERLWTWGALRNLGGDHAETCSKAVVVRVGEEEQVMQGSRAAMGSQVGLEGDPRWAGAGRRRRGT